MHDALPVQSSLLTTIETSCTAILESFGYGEIRLPLLEKTELFKRSIGDHTDIVSKEMYTFEDRNGDSLTLRPEGTAGCVRAAIEHGLINSQQRLWYAGPFFRHERPQKGRLRQFNQVGAETFAMAGPDIDCELIAITALMFNQLNIANLRLKINTLGTADARQRYSQELLNWLEPRAQHLDEDSRKRLLHNPLRIFDSKDPQTQEIMQEAPRLYTYIDDDSRLHFNKLRYLLDDRNISYQYDPFLVRGLDYYNKTVFEWMAATESAQATVCAGGRYDELVVMMGGKATPAAGFALGVERLALLLHETQNLKIADIYVVAVGETAERRAYHLVDRLRAELPSRLRLVMNCGGGSFKAQMRRADKSGGTLALIIGDDEVRAGTIGVKDLRNASGQSTLPQEQLLPCIKTHFSF